VIRPLGEDGPYVVKDPGSGAYYHLGDEEHFLLTQLDGQRDDEAIRAAFAARFGQVLTEAELAEFVQMARARGLLQGWKQQQEQEDRRAEKGSPGEADPRTAPYGLRVLYWRKSFFDPDRLFSWLAPKLWFFWTPAFVAFSAACIGLAVVLLWANRYEAAHSFRSALRWETAVLAWLALMVVMTCHEFAHGLTCKRHGGEVHEVGFLLLFFMPCFYCNVSDAWLIKEKSKRLWVTLAGGYFELFLWALAVLVWRVTMPNTLVNYLAFVVLSACGVQTLFNFNPLLKLDGYYLLSDALEAPNLQKRSAEYVRGWLRCLLWGAARPQPDERAGLLLTYGLASWLYSLAFLLISLFVLSYFLGTRWGILGFVWAALLMLLSLRGLLHGFTAGEVRKMILFRRKRTVVWALLLGGSAAALCLVEMEDRAGGPFRLHPASHVELRAPVTGFLRGVYFDEGDRVSPGEPLARLEVPDLVSRLCQKQAEVREVEARLRLLKIGPRPEEVAEQRQRVARARAWRDLARQDLARTRQALAEELERLEKQITACRAELDFARGTYQRALVLAQRKAIPEEQFQEAEGRHRVCQARLTEAQAARRAVQAKGTLEAEAELARRERELADARAALRLLEAGTRPEEVEAEKARLARLQEEIRHLQEQQQKQAVSSSVSGLVTTPRLKEKVGQYLHEGDIICVVEEPGGLEAEITVAEEDVARVRPGQAVDLKARALPFETFATRVERVAPAAGRGEVQSSVTAYCRLDTGHADLRPDMTGHARVYTGRRPVGRILLDRVLRFVRTEFWW
jgi:multidrug resistance efflux pump